eukprot:3862633-Amphidinium_carterae.1
MDTSHTPSLVLTIEGGKGGGCGRRRVGGIYGDRGRWLLLGLGTVPAAGALPRPVASCALVEPIPAGSCVCARALCDEAAGALPRALDPCASACPAW